MSCCVYTPFAYVKPAKTVVQRLRFDRSTTKMGAQSAGHVSARQRMRWELRRGHAANADKLQTSGFLFAVEVGDGYGSGFLA